MNEKHSNQFEPATGSRKIILNRLLRKAIRRKDLSMVKALILAKYGSWSKWRQLHLVCRLLNPYQFGPKDLTEFEATDNDDLTTPDPS